MAISSYEDMSPFPLSEELLKANGWQKSLNGVNMLFADFESISIGLRPSALFYEAFCPILFPDSSKRMHDAMFMYEIESVHELQALLDMWKVRDVSRVSVKSNHNHHGYYRLQEPLQGREKVR